MAAIGEVSSLITLITVAVQVARQAAELCQDFEDAPRQLQAVSRRMTFLRTLLQELKNARDELSASETLPTSCREVIGQALQHTWTTVIGIQRARNKHVNVHGAGTRLRWALLGKRMTNTLFQSLHDTELELILAVNLIQCRTELITMKSISKLQSSLDERFDASSLVMDNTTSSSNSPFLPDRDLVKCSPTQMQVSYTSASSTFLRALGIRGCLLSYSCQNGWRYHVILRFRFLRHSALDLELGIRILPAAGSGFSVFRQQLSLRNIVGGTSPIMVASRQGDLQTVQTLFEIRGASPFDITEDGTTPLELAIESGNKYLVEFLLMSGADSNTIIDGESGSSVLQLALSDHNSIIARLLLRWGACRWHVDAYGWTNMFYIWARPHANGIGSQQCLQLLLSECYPALTSYDTRNGTVLHRAASFGSPDDVNLLLRNGANPRATVNGWTPVYRAICRENHRVIPELVKAGLDINYQDGGGWTLLHLAARKRSKLLLDCLFKLGANPHIKGAPNGLYWKQYHEKSQLIEEHERYVTPLDLARSQGEDCFQNYLLAAQEAGIDVSWDSDGDTFWPAEENLSITETL